MRLSVIAAVVSVATIAPAAAAKPAPTVALEVHLSGHDTVPAGRTLALYVPPTGQAMKAGPLNPIPAPKDGPMSLRFSGLEGKLVPTRGARFARLIALTDVELGALAAAIVSDLDAAAPERKALEAAGQGAGKALVEMTFHRRMPNAQAFLAQASVVASQTLWFQKLKDKGMKEWKETVHWALGGVADGKLVLKPAATAPAPPVVPETPKAPETPEVPEATPSTSTPTARPTGSDAPVAEKTGACAGGAPVSGALAIVFGLGLLATRRRSFRPRRTR